MKSKILITGGAGFIGKHLVAKLMEKHSVSILDLVAVESSAESGDLRGCVQTVRGSVNDSSLDPSFFDQFDTVIHAAGIAGVDQVMRKPFTTMETNLFGSSNILKKVSKSVRKPRVILFSTSEVYGPQSVEAVETDPSIIGSPQVSRWHYASSKSAMEHLAFAYAEEFGLRISVVRPFNVFGPGQKSGGAIKTFLSQAMAGLPITVHGDGSQTRSWCYVSDFAEAISLCVEGTSADGEILNIGNPTNLVSSLELAKYIVRVSNSKSSIKLVAQLDAFINVRQPDISKAKALLGWEPIVSFEDGIAKTMAALASR